MPQNSPEERPAALTSASALVRALNRYREPSLFRSIFEIAVTAAPLIVLWVLAWLALQQGWWWGILLTIPAAGFLARLFMIQHDCGHGAFFRHRAANDWVGRVIGVLTLTPYDYWRSTHAIHHATSGNLDRRELGAVETLTVEEYEALPWWRKLGYRLYRNPIVMFGVGPAYMFVLQHRLPVGLMKNGWRPWISAMATNAAIAAIVVALIWIGGVWPFLLVQLPIALLAATIGVWLFYVQHQYDGTHWARAEAWSLRDSALRGSSHYDLPGVLRWFTANIGVHHVHHLSSRIPFYRLNQVMRDHPEIRDIGRITLGQSFRTVTLSLWDEAGQRLISFRELRRRRRAGA